MSSNTHSSIQEALETAIQAVEGGDLQQGEAALSWVLQKEPDNAVAWIWLACCAPDDSAREACYRRVSAIQAG
jgi:predicted negative regulator of RcsB-dependent stress response